MQEFHNENQVFPLYFLIFVFQNILDMNEAQAEGVFRKVFKCSNQQFVSNKRNMWK